MSNGPRPEGKIQQLQLIDGALASAPRSRRDGQRASARKRTFSLDARTKAIGREGVAQAKAILSQVTPPEPLGQRHRQAS